MHHCRISPNTFCSLSAIADLNYLVLRVSEDEGLLEFGVFIARRKGFRGKGFSVRRRCRLLLLVKALMEIVMMKMIKQDYMYNRQMVAWRRSEMIESCIVL